MKKANWALGRQRLLFLADVLDIADKGHELSDERTYSQKVFVHPCGAPACALGHYAAQFPRRFRIKPPGGVFNSNGSIIDALTDAPTLHFNNSETIRNEFAITETEADELFSSSGCDHAATSEEAANYIRKFVARKDRRVRAKAKAKAR